MKINKINDTDYKIYYYKDINNKSLYDEVKEVIKKIQKRLKLSGLYKAIVISKKIGIFIELKRIGDTYYKDTLDLKIEVVDGTIYYETTDYFMIKDLSDIRYKDGMYHCVVDDSFDEILEKVEFGDFIW